MDWTTDDPVYDVSEQAGEFCTAIGHEDWAERDAELLFVLRTPNSGDGFLFTTHREWVEALIEPTETFFPHQRAAARDVVRDWVTECESGAISDETFDAKIIGMDMGESTYEVETRRRDLTNNDEAIDESISSARLREIRDDAVATV